MPKQLDSIRCDGFNVGEARFEGRSDQHPSPAQFDFFGSSAHLLLEPTKVKKSSSSILRFQQIKELLAISIKGKRG